MRRKQTLGEIAYNNRPFNPQELRDIEIASVVNGIVFAHSNHAPQILRAFTDDELTLHKVEPGAVIKIQ